MSLVAGPQGSGKSTFFPVAQSGHDSFNVDDHRKTLNSGSSQNISPAIQRQAQSDYESFIEEHIRDESSFSIEVTLGKEVTFEQARKAQAAGFSVQLTYVATDLEDCIERVAARIEGGGHGVQLGILKKTYVDSMKNLPRAIREFDVVQVHDNSKLAAPDDDLEGFVPRLVLETQGGVVVYRDPNLPQWLKAALK